MQERYSNGEAQKEAPNNGSAIHGSEHTSCIFTGAMSGDNEEPAILLSQKTGEEAVYTMQPDAPNMHFRDLLVQEEKVSGEPKMGDDSDAIEFNNMVEVDDEELLLEQRSLLSMQEQANNPNKPLISDQERQKIIEQLFKEERQQEV